MEQQGKVISGLAAIASLAAIYSAGVELTGDRFRCQDGSVESDRDDCPAPRGKSGLGWVFPSLASAPRCELLDKPVVAHKIAVYECETHHAESGDHYLIRYTAWDKPKWAEGYYEEQYARRSEAFMLGGESVGREWSTDSNLLPGGLPFKMSGILYDAAFSWSIEASSSAALTRGYDELEVRSKDQWSVDQKLSFAARLLHPLPGL